MDEKDFLVEVTEDRPNSGMWHTGPNAAWVTVTHLPTMIQARAYDERAHLAKQTAMTCCQLMVEQSRLAKCQFSTRVWGRPCRT